MRQKRALLAEALAAVDMVGVRPLLLSRVVYQHAQARARIHIKIDILVTLNSYIPAK